MKNTEQALQTLKQRIIFAFVPIAVVLIFVIGIVLSELISSSIEQQSSALSRQIETDLNERLQNTLKTFDLVVTNQIQLMRAASTSLVKVSEFQNYVEKGRVHAVIQKLNKLVNSHNLEFASVLDVDGNVLASIPNHSDDTKLTNLYGASNLSPAIRALGKNDGTTVGETGFLEIAHGMLGLPTQSVSPRGQLSLISTNVVESDYGVSTAEQN